jgi:hypothetical protein
MARFSPETLLSRAQDMLASNLDQETVLMSIEAGAYYGLEGSARSIWELLETPLRFSELVDRLVEGYEVTPEACAASLGGFLEEMEREGLLRVA